MVDTLNSREFTEEEAQAYNKLYAEAGLKVRKVVEDVVFTTITVATVSDANNQIGNILTETQNQTDALLKNTIPKSYNRGVQRVNDLIKSAKPLSDLHIVQVNSLINDASFDFKTGLVGIQKSANKIMSRALQEQLRDRILEGVAAERSQEAIGKQVLNILKDQGFTTIIARDGKNLKLTAYSDMLSKTHISRAINEGIIKRGNELGVTIYEVNTSPGTKDDACLDVAGQFFDTTGRKFPVPPFLPIHPRCVHEFIPHPEL